MNLTAIIEVTENCNLRCSFCLRPSFASSIMSKNTLEKIIAHIISYSDKNADFIWHGGEPLLGGIDFFKLIPKTQEKYNAKSITIRNNVQTNATLLNDNFINFFQREGFEIGTSIQGTPEIHDRSRLMINNEPTYHKIISNISKLNKKPASIFVLTKEVLGKEKVVYESIKPFVRGMRISEYFPTSTNRQEGKMPTPKEYGESMIKFYEVWKNDMEPIDLRPITEIIKSFIMGRSEGCLYSQQICNHSIIGIKSTGDFYTCIRGASEKEFWIGHVDNEPLKDYEDKTQKAKEERVQKLKEGPCNSCQYWSYCNGGCPIESWRLYT